MKKLLAAILTISMLLSITACGSSDDKKPSDDTSKTESSQTEKPDDNKDKPKPEEAKSVYILPASEKAPSEAEAIEAVQDAVAMWDGMNITYLREENRKEGTFATVEVNSVNGPIEMFYVSDDGEVFYRTQHDVLETLKEPEFTDDDLEDRFEDAEEYALAFDSGWRDMDCDDTYRDGDIGYCRVDNFDSKAELEKELESIFTKNMVQKLMTNSPMKFVDKDGKLYVSDGARGTSRDFAFVTYDVVLETADMIDLSQKSYRYIYGSSDLPEGTEFAAEQKVVLKKVSGQWLIDEIRPYL